MEIPQLKRLAGRVRTILANANHAVSHNQSLDLIAAIPGLRNWPEVQAFSDRVAACELDATSARRLAYRLQHKFAFELSPQDLLTALSPPDARDQSNLPTIWPAGPAAGIYVTTSKAAIDALVGKYEEATDGALLYTERAVSGCQGAIDLGEYGLWSSGLDRVPSGTLIVVGPLELVQDEWERSAERLQIACTHAELSRHRVAVLAKTPKPDDLREDMRVLARTDADGLDYESALRGMVTEAGDLVEVAPFARPWPPLTHVRCVAKTEAIPSPARELLVQALQGRRSGLMVFGSDSLDEHWAADLVDAALALTEHAGPAARIMPRIRSTPAKDWRVPEATKQLPFLPSIQSAYDRGYRRMVINPHYIEGNVLKDLATQVLFIAGTHDYEASTIAYGGIRFGSAVEQMEHVAHVICLLGVMRLPTKSGLRPIADLFLGSEGNFAESFQSREIGEYVARHRALKWEDEIARLFDSGEVTAADLKSMDMRPSMAARFKEVMGTHSNGTSTVN